MAANSNNSSNNNNQNHLSDEKVEKDKDKKIVTDDKNGDSQNNNHPEEVDKDKDDVMTVEKVVKVDDDGNNSDGGNPKDENNNNYVQHDDQVPDGAVGLPEEDVEMAEVGCGRVLANQVAQAVEAIQDGSRAWFRLWMPDGEPGVVAVGLHTTVGEVNARLAAMFGRGVYFMGYRLVTGLTISAALGLTMSQLDQMGLDLGVGNMAEDWFGESRED